MTTVLLVGTGAVGVRAGRQLYDTPGIDRLLLGDRNLKQAERFASALGERAGAVACTPGDSLPEGIDAVALALPAEADIRLARDAIAAGVPFASAVDDAEGITSLLALDERARTAGIIGITGCGLAPGLSDVLARHASSALGAVDEIHVARSGTAGPASLTSLRRARREPALEWHDRAWREERRRDPELIWFPDPIGARECEPVASGVALLVRAFPGVARATMRMGEPPVRRGWPGRRGLDDDWGSARVEVWGWRGQTRESVVYGVIDRTAIATGTVLAIGAAWLAGVLPALTSRGALSPGVHGLATLVEPVPFLAELARWGVKAAVFEGVAVA